MYIIYKYNMYYNNMFRDPGRPRVHWTLACQGISSSLEKCKGKCGTESTECRKNSLNHSSVGFTPQPLTGGETRMDFGWKLREASAGGKSFQIALAGL